MPLSDQTLAEIRAGAAEIAKQTGKTAVDLDAVVRTQQRAFLLKKLEQEGTITIEKRATYPNLRYGDTHAQPQWETVVHVGPNQFVDDVASVVGGGWPSEKFIADIVLAIAAGEHRKKTGWTGPDC